VFKMWRKVENSDGHRTEVGKLQPVAPEYIMQPMGTFVKTNCEY